MVSQSSEQRAVVVVPSRNEGPKIASVIGEIRKGFQGTRYTRVTVLVVDDSTDDTRTFAAEAGASVLRGTGEGLGVAMYRGLKAAAHAWPVAVRLPPAAA